jgi:FMN phosphatase YigB (HAD superfamily)
MFAMARVHSFDVFDTSLIRKVAAPTDVFRLLGTRIGQKAGIPDQKTFTEDFVSARVRAEEQAKLHCEETTIEKIWVILREIVPELRGDVGPQHELDAEQELILPNAITVQQIAALRSTGARIVFTSDTYLPETFVRKQLLRHGVAEEGDGIYVSSAAGVTKRHGGLFNIVLKREGITPKDLHHYGDNPHNDITMPRRFGIEATLLTYPLNTWERSILSKDVRHRLAASLLAGSMRAFRLSGALQSENRADELVATFLGPALMVWAAWVLGRAQQDGIQRLYFVSRQGYLLCRAARAMAPQFCGIECRDLKISRRSILLPSTDEVGPYTMPWLRQPRPMALGELVVKLGLKWSDVAQQFFPLADGKGELKLLASERDWDEFWNIVQSPSIAAALRERIQHARENVLAYLRAEGLLDDVPVGIVDIGWFMAVQSCLRRLLKHVNSASTMKGYFLGLCRTRLPPAEAGKVTALFYDHAFDHNSISPGYEIFKRIDLLDHVFGLAPHGTVQEYKVNGSTVEAVCPSESVSYTAFVDRLQDAIVTFCKSNQVNASWYSDSDTAAAIIDALFNAWCTHPNKIALNALDEVIVTDGTDGITSQSLLQSWRLSDAAKTLVPRRLAQRLNMSAFNPVWPEAALCRSSRISRFLLRLSTKLRSIKRAARRNTAAI